MEKFFVAVAVVVVIVVNAAAVNGIVTNRTADFVEFILSQSDPTGPHILNSDRCTSRLHGSLEKLRKRQANLKSSAFIDLSGYALHQTLRHLPLDMYVTDIRVRTPGVGDWVRIEKCQFSNRDHGVTARILFNDLSVSGTVRLLDDSETLKSSRRPVPREICKMTLRFQRAGLGINAIPMAGRSRNLQVRTEARFLDPKYLSVHAYGCKLSDIFRKRENGHLEPFESERDDANDDDAPRPEDEGTRYTDSGRRGRFHHGSAYSGMGYSNGPHRFHAIDPRSARDATPDETPEVRIVTLNPDIRTGDDSSKWVNLHNEDETDLNDFHRLRIIGTRLHALSERDKLKAILHVQNLIAQQANHVFQTQGPFSQMPNPGHFKPVRQPFPKPQPVRGHTVISTITELDENLTPIRPVPQRPFDALFSPSDQVVHDGPDLQNYYEVISREMEDIFLRGIKTLLTRYVEKQLEIPLKEALMVNIGYTVSYG